MTFVGLCGERMVRVLLVEDESASIRDVQDALSHISDSVDLVIASERDEAIAAIDQGEFDFAICDLRIPPRRGSADVAEEYGFEVHRHLQRVAPGTPSLFFTGFATPKNIRNELAAGESHDIFGTGELYPLVQLLMKDELRECAAGVERMVEEFANMDAIEVRLINSRSSPLSERQLRALKIYARRNNGASVSLIPLTGLSGSVALRATVFNASEQPTAKVFCKMGLRDKTLSELENYQGRVPNLLPTGVFAPHVYSVTAGIGMNAAVFFSVAEPFNDDMLETLMSRPEMATPIVTNLITALQPWSAVRETRTARLTDLVPKPCPMELIESSFPSDSPLRTGFLDRDFTIPFSLQHGDLHCKNVLVGRQEDVLLIDFADVDVLPTCLDPVTLELSILFHKESPLRDQNWPSLDQASRWFSVDAYCEGSQHADFVRACRNWALSEAGSSSVLAAVVLAQCLRQLKYEDADKDLVVAICNAALALILSEA